MRPSDIGEEKIKVIRKVLLISYPFPPLGAAGSLRPYRFAKYLPKFSWMPIVLTIKERKDVPKDYALLNDFPTEVSIYRTTTFDPYLLYKAYRSDTKKLARNDHQLSISEAENTEDKGGGLVGSVLKKIRRFLLDLITTPDHQVFWFPFAVLKGASLILKNNIDVLLTTSPPHSAHLIGLALKKICRIPWIADFRDPWVENFKLRDGLPSWQSGLERRLERMVIVEADRVIANTMINRKSLLKRYPYLDVLKFITIPNGFECLSIDKKAPFDKFTVTHTGIFYPMLKPYFFFEALKKWLENKGQELRARVQVLLIGEQNHSTRSIIKHLSLEDVVKFIDRLPQKEALKIACASDMLLISLGFDQRNAGWVPIKLYDYLYCTKPILAFLPNGEAASIIEETKSGYIINSADFKNTISILDKEYQKKFGSDSEKFRLEFNVDKIDRFGVEYLTKRLAMLMSEVSK